MGNIATVFAALFVAGGLMLLAMLVVTRSNTRQGELAGALLGYGAFLTLTGAACLFLILIMMGMGAAIAGVIDLLVMLMTGNAP